MPSEKNNFVSDGFMEYIYVLDSTYTKKLIIDHFVDFLWVERYNRSGEFEIRVPVSVDVVKGCRLNDYVCIRESDTYMIVETITVHTDPEDGDTMTISGRTLDSILDRRVIWGKIENESIGTQALIKQIITDNIISPSNDKRKIPNFTFKESTDEKVTKLVKKNFESTGGNVYDEVRTLCEDEDIGFRVVPKGDGGFEFELYFGTDRSGDQELIPTVVFSDSYENLKESDYIQSEKDHKSTACVRVTYDTESGSSDAYVEVIRKEPEKTGLARREMYISGGSNLTQGEILEEAKETLKDYLVTRLFDGETEPSRQFVYGVDYFLGDIVQLENKYGQRGKCRVTEIARSRDASGPSLVPTFEGIEDDDE